MTVSVIHRFVKPVEPKLNPLRIVELARRVSREYPSEYVVDLTTSYVIADLT